MSKRNENRPGYKKTKIGWIPKEWHECTLGSIAKVTSGGSPDRKERSYWGGDIPWITTSLIDFRPIRKAEEFITDIGLKKSSAKLFPAGTILLALYGQGVTRGKVGLLGIDATTNQACAAIIIKRQDIEQFFVYQFLISKYQNLRNMSYDGGQKNLSGALVKETRILLPPLPEQKKIAKILSAFVRAVEQISKLIEAKQKLKKALMQQLLTGRVRFSGFGKPVKKKGKLPDGWKNTSMKDCFKERRETNLGLPLLSITSARGVIPRDEIARKDSSNADKSKYKRIIPGDIGYNTMRMWQGVSAVSSLEGIVSPAYTICEPKKGNISNFFGYLFKHPPIVNLFHRYSQGLVSDTLNLKFHHFALVKAAIPSEAEQTRIANLLSSVDRGSTGSPR